MYWRSAPAEHTFINTKIIAEAPDKYLWAGIGDTLLRVMNLNFHQEEEKLDHSNALGVTLSKTLSGTFSGVGSKALADCKEIEYLMT